MPLGLRVAAVKRDEWRRIGNIKIIIISKKKKNNREPSVKMYIMSIIYSHIVLIKLVFSLVV